MHGIQLESTTVSQSISVSRSAVTDIAPVRGPCPMMNTLANHGFIPHDGRNITKANAIKGLGDSLNFDASLASLMWDQAIIVNPVPNATFFTL